MSDRPQPDPRTGAALQPPADIPASWESALAALAGEPGRRILVVGAADRGKSTFCRLLLQRLRATGRCPALVDADIGQKDLGPPACVTMGRTDEAGLAPTATAFYFVGAVSPGGHFLPCVVGTRRLTEATGEGVAVINTPGTVHGPGRILQQFQAESLRPDAVVVLERDNEAAGLLAGFTGPRVLRLPASPRARSRSPARRRRNRERAFRAYFAGAEQHTWDLGRIGFQRCLLFSGRPLPRGSHLHAEETGEGRLVVGGPEASGVVRLPPGFERDLLCGVVDIRGDCRGLARLLGIDFRTRRVTVSTPVPPEEAAALQLGALYLGAGGRELDRSRPRGL